MAKIKEAKLSDLVPDDRNANKHSEYGTHLLGKSLEENGLGRSTLISADNKIIAGNGVTEAAAERGIEKVVIIETDGKELIAVKRTDIQSGTADFYKMALADNIVAAKNIVMDVEVTAALAEEYAEVIPWAEVVKPEEEKTITKEEASRKLTDVFIIPPFSVLDTRQGYWQRRKRAWLALGIRSEIGRGGQIVFSERATIARNGRTAESFKLEKPKSDRGGLLHSGETTPWGEYQGGTTAWQGDGTSIFDPVLCEIIYRWFCPSGGTVLDPFAGGSVRGIVASWLGLSYTGIELRKEQVEANGMNAREINLEPEKPEKYMVKVSAKMARLLFNGCDPEYIRDVCHASCCQSSTAENGTMITIHPSEEEGIRKLGGVIENGLLQPKPGCKKCPFKTEADLCGLHNTQEKPFGCIASPFTLNEGDTLIVRNRYRLLKCYNDGKKQPAYKAFRASLDLIFGAEEAERICSHLEAGGGDIMAEISPENYEKLKTNDNIKHGVKEEAGKKSKPFPKWIQGNSLVETPKLKGSFDLVFSCPPYHDLEVYSELKEDLSNMPYQEFLGQYRAIIEKAVKKLKEDRFACFVVADIRDEAGFYKNFVSETIKAFQDAGAKLYNEIILVNAIGSLSIRVARQFNSGRKAGKMHQNVLIFYKGNPGNIKKNFPALDFSNVVNDLEEETQE